MSAEGLAGSFGSVAEQYERGRPEWPEAAIDLAGLPADAEVLDLAAGTGKLTRLLVQRYARVVAVEPLEPMRRILEAASAGSDVRPGTAEAIPLDRDSVDAVFCAEAFHWFDWPRALAEIERVLRSSGTLVLLWNRPAADVPPPWPAEVDAALDAASRELETRSRYASPWREAFAGTPFEPLRFATVPHRHVLDHAGVLAYFASQSILAGRPRYEREEILAGIAEHLEGDVFVVHLETHVHWTRLR